MKIIHEEVFLELAPDRGSEQVREPLDKLMKLANEQDARILLVDFGAEIGERSHLGLRRLWRVQEERFEFVPCSSEEDRREIKSHFRAWRSLQREWSDQRQARRQLALDKARALQAQGFSHSRIADQLNQQGIPTPTGRRWSRDNVSKLLAGNSPSGNSSD